MILFGREIHNCEVLILMRIGHEWGVDALATDPVEPNRVYVMAGMYMNSWDPNNASLLRSEDYGRTWSRTPLPFRAGGNQPGRGMGERLTIDPNNNKIIYFGARSGHGLWKSVDQGLSFHNVTSFTAVGTSSQTQLIRVATTVISMASPQ